MKLWTSVSLTASQRGELPLSCSSTFSTLALRMSLDSLDAPDMGMGCAPRSSASVVSCSNPVFVYQLNMHLWPGNLSVLNSFDRNDATTNMWICELSSSASTRMMVFFSNTWWVHTGDHQEANMVSMTLTTRLLVCRNFKGTERYIRHYQATLYILNIIAALFPASQQLCLIQYI